MTERARRCRPRRAPRSLIQARDVGALASLARARFLTTTQVQRLNFGGSRRVAQRRLRVLLDHGLIVGTLQGEQLHRASIFRPTTRGLELLADHGHNLDGMKIARLPRPGKLRHAIGTRELFVAAVELEQQGVWKLDAVFFDSELAAEPVLRAAKLVPDVLVRTRSRLGLEAVVVLVELDLGTEPVATLAAKLERYEFLRAGAVEYAKAEIVFVVEGDGRRRRIASLAEGRRVHVVAPEATTSTLTALGGCPRDPVARLRHAERTGVPAQPLAVTAVSGLRKTGV